MGWLRKKYESAKGGIKDEMKYRKSVRQAEKTSYREAKLKAAEDYGKKKAQYEEQQKFKQLKQPKSYNFKGFAGPTQKTPVASLGIGDTLLGGGGGSKKRKKGFDMPDLKI
jgi:hypothetical protein